MQRYQPQDANPNVVALLKVCRTEDEFFNKYGLEKVSDYVMNYRDRMIIGNAPSLSTIKLAYGEQAMLDWINLYLVDVAIFFGKTNNAEPYQVNAISQTIYENYHYLKASELMLFFSMFKGGKLKDKSGKNTARMYGSFDGAAIMDGLDRFIETINTEIDKYKQKQRIEQDQEWTRAKDLFVNGVWEDCCRADKERKDKARAEIKQSLIDQHNREFLKMLESKQYINK